MFYKPFRPRILLRTVKYCMNQYCAYTQDTDSMRVALELIRTHNLKFEVHLNRTRFWVDTNSELNTYCALCFKCVNNETNHALGI